MDVLESDSIGVVHAVAVELGEKDNASRATAQVACTPNTPYRTANLGARAPKKSECDPAQAPAASDWRLSITPTLRTTTVRSRSCTEAISN